MKNTPYRFFFLFAILSVVFLRGVSLETMSLVDTTEGRYGSIAKLMYESGNYITPQIIYEGVETPYWSKPPLHLWVTAGAYSLFGVGEFGARFPSFLAAFLVLCATVFFANSIWGFREGMIAGGVLSTSILFFVISGTCIFDMTLAAAIAGAMVSFPLCIRAESLFKRRVWGNLFFAFLAIGMLVKGPVAVVLVGVSLVLWLFVCRAWRLLRCLPWISGPIVFLFLTLPWYIAAERATPGFLEYFILHEHVYRYLIRQYGDKYGHGHVAPYGYIWVMLLGSFLPWTLVLFAPLFEMVKGVWSRKNKASTRAQNLDPQDTHIWYIYAFCWGIGSAVFFTFARQVIPTYIIYGLPGLAVICGVWISRAIEEEMLSEKFFRYTIYVLVGLSIGPVVAAFFLKGNIFIPLLFACISGGMCFFSLRTRSRDQLFFLVPVLIALVYTGLYFASGNSLSMRRSTELLLRFVDEKYPEENVQTYFPFEVPFSAYFYAHTPVHRGWSNGGDSSTDIVIMKSKNFGRLTKEQQSHIERDVDMGKWSIFHMKGSVKNERIIKEPPKTIHIITP